ncbi:MAG: DUF1573 domain-containing protein [Planctomycetes bacterium]|nr:DUF1573 domain-containing protein [Planctomycetota bacterium]
MGTAEETESPRRSRVWRRLDTHHNRLAIVVIIVAAAYAFGYWHNHSPVSQNAAEPSFVGFEPAEIDLGDHMWGEVVPFCLTLANRSSVAVVVDSVRSSCGCAVIETDGLHGQMVEAGDIISLEGTLDTETNPGFKRRRIELGDAAGRTYCAILAVNVRGTWTVSPDMLDFGDVDVTEAGAEAPAELLSFVSDSDSMVGEPLTKASWCNTSPVCKIF